MNANTKLWVETHAILKKWCLRPGPHLLCTCASTEVSEGKEFVFHEDPACIIPAFVHRVLEPHGSLWKVSKNRQNLSSKNILANFVVVVSFGLLWDLLCFPVSYWGQCGTRIHQCGSTCRIRPLFYNYKYKLVMFIYL